MGDVSARHDARSEVDVVVLILRRIAIAPHPLTLADVRMADDGGATLDPQATVTKLEELHEQGLIETWDDPYPKCIKVRGYCPPQAVYDLTSKGKLVHLEYEAGIHN